MIRHILLYIAATISLLPVVVSAQENRPQTIDDEFYAIAQEAPAFGGLYLCEQEGGLCVNTTDSSPAKVTAIREAIDRRFGEQFRGMPTVPIPAQFSFAQLYEWHQQIVQTLSISGIVFTDIDEKRNRITIGVSTNSAKKAVEREIARLNIPSEAVVVDDTEPVVTLSDTEKAPDTVEGWLIDNWPLIGVGGVLFALGIYWMIRLRRR